jgi:hypothetical protein
MCVTDQRAKLGNAGLTSNQRYRTDLDAGMPDAVLMQTTTGQKMLMLDRIFLGIPTF